ncbi:hypothetical protein [Piscirickettsia salmonis]|uniref:hypothetical protein n=1 Tax=Piscirickettsia salmonis TaxID=1238 RepID=UPI0007C92328|nr:hypothetical protein A0O36_01038 [Piscirickettsiaceae bacterium NZ-RLO1]
MDFSQADKTIAKISDTLDADHFDQVIPACHDSITLLEQVCTAIDAANQANYSKQLFFNDHVTLQRILTTAMETIFKCRAIQNSFEFQTLLIKEQELVIHKEPPHSDNHTLHPEQTHAAIKQLINASKTFHLQLIHLNSLIMTRLES